MNWNRFRYRVARAVRQATGLARNLQVQVLAALSHRDVSAMIALYYLVKAQGDPSYLVLSALYAIEALYRESG